MKIKIDVPDRLIEVAARRLAAKYNTDYIATMDMSGVINNDQMQECIEAVLPGYIEFEADSLIECLVNDTSKEGIQTMDGFVRSKAKLCWNVYGYDAATTPCGFVFFVVIEPSNIPASIDNTEYSTKELALARAAELNIAFDKEYGPFATYADAVKKAEEVNQ
jgi:hypothetical protein